MAIMRAKEVRKMGDVELKEKEVELKKDHMKLRSQVASGTPPENPGRIRAIRRTLARINTIRREKGGKK